MRNWRDRLAPEERRRWAKVCLAIYGLCWLVSGAIWFYEISHLGNRRWLSLAIQGLGLPLFLLALWLDPVDTPKTPHRDRGSSPCPGMDGYVLAGEPDYFAEGGDLWIVEKATGRLLWRGRPGGFSVLKACPLPGTQDVVVLLHYRAHWESSTAHNVVRVTTAGEVVWKAAPPELGTNDTYTDLWVSEVGIRAFSWSCHKVRLDPETGRIVECVFTK
jgi:hypothetical protein